MRLLASADLPGPIARVRLHPRRPWLAALARTARTDSLAVWQVEADGRLTELLRKEDSAPEPDHALPAWPGRPPWPQPGRLMDLAFHPQQDWLAVVKLQEPVGLLQVPHGALLRHLGAAPADNAVAFSPCGRWAVHDTRPAEEGEGDAARSPWLYDLGAGTATALAWETDTTYAFHPSGRVLAGGWNDQGGGMVRFLELPYDPRRRAQELDAAGWAHGLAFSPDGASLAAVEGAAVEGHFCLGVYDFTPEPYPSARRRFAAEWHVSLPPRRGRWSGRKERQRQALLQEGQGFDLPWPERVVFSPDGSRLLYPGPAGELVEVDARGGEECRRWQAHGKLVTSLDADFGRGLVASGGRDGKVQLWEAGWPA